MDERNNGVHGYLTHIRTLPIPARFSFWSVDVVLVLVLSFLSTPNVSANSFTPFRWVRPRADLLTFEPTLTLIVPCLYLIGEFTRFTTRGVGRLAGRRTPDLFVDTCWTLTAVGHLTLSGSVGDDMVSEDAQNLTGRS